MNANFDISCVVITTPRLVLREWRQADLNDFYEYAKIDGVGQMAGWMPHEDIRKTQEILNTFIKGKKTFAIYHKEDKKVIGSLGIEKYNEAMKEFDYLEGRELGYVLSKAYWNRGIMTEAVHAVVEYLFNTMRYDFITCGHFIDNVQSKRVQEKNGFIPYRRLFFDTVTGEKKEGILSLITNPKRNVKIEARNPETLIYKPLVITPQQMWTEFCNKTGVAENTPYEAWAFGCEENNLARLVLKGIKKATTSLYDLYEFEGEELPKVGRYNVILNKDGYAICVTKNTIVEVKPFCDVDAEYAKTEGEGDKTLKYWRDVHTRIFTEELKEETGRDFNTEMKVVCEIFEVVYK